MDDGFHSGCSINALNLKQSVQTTVQRHLEHVYGRCSMNKFQTLLFGLAHTYKLKPMLREDGVEYWLPGDNCPIIHFRFASVESPLASIKVSGVAYSLTIGQASKSQYTIQHSLIRSNFACNLRHLHSIVVNTEHEGWESKFEEKVSRLVNGLRISEADLTWNSIEDVIRDYRISFNRLGFKTAVSQLERYCLWTQYNALQNGNHERAGIVRCALIKILQQCGYYKRASEILDDGYLDSVWASLSSETTDAIDSVRFRIVMPKFGAATKALEEACSRFRLPRQRFHRNRFAWRRSLDAIGAESTATVRDVLKEYRDSSGGAPIQQANISLVNGIEATLIGDHERSLECVNRYRLLQEDVMFGQPAIADPAIQGVLTGLEFAVLALSAKSPDSLKELQSVYSRIDLLRKRIGIGSKADGLRELDLIVANRNLHLPERKRHSREAIDMPADIQHLKSLCNEVDHIIHSS